mmetsp:Transcript_13414/g.22291  ORF Transcript_13414/g.22291 Transcript_13414/m.22291 type:complete len:92 (-) Transcript_13414:889-1164(-)
MLKVIAGFPSVRDILVLAKDDFDPDFDPNDILRLEDAIVVLMRFNDIDLDEITLSLSLSAGGEDCVELCAVDDSLAAPVLTVSEGFGETRK